MYREYLPPDNKSKGKINECKVIGILLLVAYQKLTKSVHKGMSDLNDPSAGMKIRIVF